MERVRLATFVPPLKPINKPTTEKPWHSLNRAGNPAAAVCDLAFSTSLVHSPIPCQNTDTYTHTHNSRETLTKTHGDLGIIRNKAFLP